jgi:hypothetical protein
MTTPVPEDEDEFTELVGATFPRVDLVDKAANGMTFLIAKGRDGAGLMDPQDVRDLIGKSAPEPAPPQAGNVQVTVTGSIDAAELMRSIHESALRRNGINSPASVMAAVGKTAGGTSTADLNDLPDSDFAYIEPGGSKDEGGRTTPRSLRHFPVHDAAHVRNALARAPQSPFGDKALPKIRAAAKKLGIEVSKAMEPDDQTTALDPSVPLAAAEGDAPGDPTTPGSPAWEAIDAATARKWTSILARAKHAVGLLSEREMIEAASADPDDAFAAMDLDDAACAIDYAISVLAPFAVAEQAEADCAADDMAAVGKALAAFDPGPLDLITAFAHVRKAGRVLSSSNEAAIRGAVDQLQKVLASLPTAPTIEDGGQTVAKQEAPVAETATPETPANDVTKAATPEAPAAAAEPAEQTPAVEPVTKETQTAQVPVYDRTGRLIGVAAPENVVPVESPDEEETADEEAAPEVEMEAAPAAADLEPAPAAEVGIPADEVAKTTAPDTTPAPSDTPTDAESSIADAVTKALEAHSATQEQVIAKQAETIAELVKGFDSLVQKVHALEEQPAVPGVFTNGAVPPQQQLRGQDAGAPPADQARVAELRKGLYTGPDAPQQHAIATELNGMAIAELQRIHSSGPQ